MLADSTRIIDTNRNADGLRLMGASIPLVALLLLTGVYRILGWHFQLGTIPGVSYYLLTYGSGLALLAMAILPPVLAGHYRISAMHWLFLVYVAFVLGNIVLARLVGVPPFSDHVVASRASSDLGSVITQSVFYVVGLVLTFDARAGRAAILVWLGILGSILMVTDFNLLTVRSWEFAQYLTIHHGMGDTFGIIAFLVLATVRRGAVAIVVVPATLVGLFFLASRGSLIAFVAALTVFTLTRRNRWVVALTLFAAAALSIPFVLDVLESDFAYQHKAVLMLRLALYEGTLGGSAEARLDQLQTGLRDIAERPLFGFYLGQIAHGGVGSYIHSAFLSTWRQFGIMPFGAMVIAAVIMVRVQSRYLIAWLQGRTAYSEVGAFLVSAGTFVLVLTLFVRSYRDEYFWLFAGLAASFGSTVRTQR